MTSFLHVFIVYLLLPLTFQLQGEGATFLLFSIMTVLSITMSDTGRPEEMKAQAYLGVTTALAWILMLFFRVGLTETDPCSSFEDSPRIEDSGRAD